MDWHLNQVAAGLQPDSADLQSVLLTIIPKSKMKKFKHAQKAITSPYTL